MTSRQHQDWINRGKPDSGLALPLQLLANTLAAAGYTVYVYPNDAHLDAQPPEDHTYYSETGWPSTSPKWWRHAIDIMPPPSGRGLPSLQQLGQRIFDARQSGQITWLKYMNWPSDGNLSKAVQDRWEPGHARGSSSDTGHIHISSATGCETLNSSFNPLTTAASPGSTSLPALKGDLVYFLALSDPPASQYYLCDGANSWPVSLDDIAVLRTLRNEGMVQIAADKQGRSTLDFPRQHWTSSFGAVQGTAKPVALSQADRDAIVSALAGLAPTAAEIGAAVDAAVKARLDGATLHTAGG